MRQIRTLLWIALAIAVARLSWIGLVRHDSRLRVQRAAEMRNESPGGAAAYTGTDLKITQFYARDGEIIDGEPGLICYGVRNAARVWMEPPVEQLSPALTRCFFVEPHADTSYTLIAEDAAGKRTSESFQLRVKPAPPEIRMLAVSDRRIHKGDAMTICYGVAHTTAVRLEPIQWHLPPAQNCVRFYPSATTKFTLVAVGEGGRTDRRAFQVAVQ